MEMYNIKDNTTYKFLLHIQSDNQYGKKGKVRVWPSIWLESMENVDDERNRGNNIASVEESSNVK